MQIQIYELDNPYNSIEYKGNFIDSIKSTPFTARQSFKELQEEDRTYIKMLSNIYDYIAKVFFAKTTIFIEGDTSELVLREIIKRILDIVKKNYDGVIY